MSGLAQAELRAIAPPRPVRRHTVWWNGAVAAALWAAAAALTLAWPDADDLGRTDLLAYIAVAIAVTLAFAASASAARPLPSGLTQLGPWLVALAAGLAGWELVTANWTCCPARSSPRRNPCWRC